MRTRVAIIGAGPVGLEAALAAREAGCAVTVYEQDPRPAGHVRAWGHVRLFTPWDWVVSARMRAVLGDAAPAGPGLPTGDELAVRVLEPVGAGLGVRTGVEVVAVARRGLLKHEQIASAERAKRPFRLHLRSGGHEWFAEADLVIDASGTYGNPNRLGDGGIDALGEAALEHRIVRTIPDARDLAGRTVLLTGTGHSAQTAARDLAAIARDAADTRIVWATRSPAPDWGAVPADPLPGRAALVRAAEDLATGASDAVELRPGTIVEALHERDGRVRVTLRNGTADDVLADVVVGLHGGAPDASIYRQLQVHECYATLGPMKLAATLGGGDCLSQPAAGADTLANPEPGFFILGAKSYGCNAQFLMRTGYEQVDTVFSALR